MFDNLGGGEVLLIFLVILIFFGPKKIPELATSFGKGMRKFRDAKSGLEDQLKTVMKEPMEALQEAKNQFDKHVAEAQVPFKETAEALEKVTSQTPTPVLAPTPVATTPVVATPPPDPIS